MFNNGIQAIHIEPTARCNAKCPMCARTNNNRVLSNQGEITLEQFQNIFPPHLIKDIYQWKWCGNFGDPVVAKDFNNMIAYVIEHNSDANHIISTNAGIRSEKFWNELGELIKKSGPKSHVQFHIDGLEDTNHIYRVGVKWDKLIRNVKAYLNTGAAGAWFYIPFMHNEEQIEEARELSKELGFDEFIVKISSRFPDSKGGFFANGAQLFPPLDPKYNIDDMQVHGELVCFAEVRKEAYVDAWGRFWPCCWTASKFAFNNTFNNDLSKRSIEEITSDPGTDKWIQSLYGDKKSVCNKRCTGQKQHVLDFGGIQKPQKELWGKVTREVIATDRG